MSRLTLTAHGDLQLATPASYVVRAGASPRSADRHASGIQAAGTRPGGGARRSSDLRVRGVKS
jgi:hypothetical protein